MFTRSPFCGLISTKCHALPGTQSAVDECCDMLEARLMEVITVRSSIATRSGHDAVDSTGAPYADASHGSGNAAKNKKDADNV